MAINSSIFYQQVLSTALEARNRGTEDLVSKTNVLYGILRRKGLMQSYSGPRIRQRLLIDLPAVQWYTGYDVLANPPREIINDAYWTPKQAVAQISLAMTEILNNQGENQILDIMSEYIDAAEISLAQGIDAAMFGDGTAFGGKVLTGLGAAVPITPTNVYGGIDRNANPMWRTKSYNINADFPTVGTQFTSTTAKPIYDTVYGSLVRGADRPDLIIASPEHWAAYNAATMAIQRINSNSAGQAGALGFQTLQYVGPGGGAEIVWGGGVGSNVPANTSFFLNTSDLRLRFNPARNFDKLFEGDGQMPINQDAIAQFIGWMGELTMTNPISMARLYDSNPAA